MTERWFGTEIVALQPVIDRSYKTYKTYKTYGAYGAYKSHGTHAGNFACGNHILLTEDCRARKTPGSLVIQLQRFRILG